MKDNIKKTESVFEERASIWAKEEALQQTTAQKIFLIFFIGNEKYGLLATDVIKVIPYQPITTLPRGSDAFPGILHYGGQLWPVVNGYFIFHKKNTNLPPANFILLKKNELTMALSVNKIEGEENYDDHTALSKISTEQAESNVMISGIYHNEIAMIDINQLFNEFNTFTGV